jgi:acyl-coenzyme A thioesterase PaaI-like protein
MSLLPAFKQPFAGLERSEQQKIRVHLRHDTVCTDIVVGRAYEGYENVAFGGMVFGILDVLMWYAIFMSTKKVCMTRKTDMDFLRPVICGRPYHGQGKLLRVEERDVWATAWIEDANHERCAEATALFREAKALEYDRFVDRFDFTDVSPEIKEFFRL